MTRAIGGLSDIAAAFEAVLLDQYGVLHDGRAPFPGAIEAVAKLGATGLRLAVISNSGKRAAANADRLTRLGFPAGAFDVVATSGEICHAHLAADLARGTLAKGTRVFTLTNGPDVSALEDLPLTSTEVPEEARLVLIAGREPAVRSLEADVARLAPMARRKVPCICSNPDEVMYAPGGTAPGPGALARAYSQAGGPVTFIGKPHPALFEAALDGLGIEDPSRTLMVGDSLSHDIAGARAVGCATLHVTSGVQSASDAPAGVAPSYEIPRFVW